MSPRLVRRAVCLDTGRPGPKPCLGQEEWFVDGRYSGKVVKAERDGALRIEKPRSGLQLAMDPRIPDSREAFEFVLSPIKGLDQVDWYLDGQLLGSSKSTRYTWPLQPGRHRLWARAQMENPHRRIQTRPVAFEVK